MLAFRQNGNFLGLIMLINNIIRALVGADLSRPPPIYRPSLPIHIIDPSFASINLPSHNSAKFPPCQPNSSLVILSASEGSPSPSTHPTNSHHCTSAQFPYTHRLYRGTADSSVLVSNPALLLISCILRHPMTFLLIRCQQPLVHLLECNSIDLTRRIPLA